jgi:hypothetical protein
MAPVVRALENCDPFKILYALYLSFGSYVPHEPIAGRTVDALLIRLRELWRHKLFFAEDFGIVAAKPRKPFTVCSAAVTFAVIGKTTTADHCSARAGQDAIRRSNRRSSGRLTSGGFD